jgi:hypothetical protein
MFNFLIYFNSIYNYFINHFNDFINKKPIIKIIKLLL